MDWDELIDPILGRSIYFDKLGNPLTMAQWAELREQGIEPDGRYGDDAYLRVAQDTVGDAWVSTVWMGIDLSLALGEHRPVIFELMIFGGPHDEYTMRFHTEEEALHAHREVVEDLRAGMEPGWEFGGQRSDEWTWKPGTGDP